MIERPKLRRSFMWTAVFGLMAMMCVAGHLHEPNEWAWGIMLGVSVGIIAVEWSSYAWLRLLADYSAVVDDYRAVVESLMQDEPTPQPGVDP